MEDNKNPCFSLHSYENQQVKYIGEYVILYTQNGASTAGKLIKIVQEYFVLNPFQSQKVEGDVFTYYLKNLEPGMSVPIANTRIEPITEEEILENYKLINLERKNEKKERLKQIQ